jgi:predicted RNase H-like nuclease (RuvC/YqgF family)
MTNDDLTKKEDVKDLEMELEKELGVSIKPPPTNPAPAATQDVKNPVLATEGLEEYLAKIKEEENRKETEATLLTGEAKKDMEQLKQLREKIEKELNMIKEKKAEAQKLKDEEEKVKALIEQHKQVKEEIQKLLSK